MNKTFINFFIIVLILFLISILVMSHSMIGNNDVNLVIAHSGRTDSDGGHYDSSTGEYHYHHGYPAHQHPNGICPYENKKLSINNDNANITSNSYSTSSNTLSGGMIALIVISSIVGLLIIIKIFRHFKTKK